MSISAVGAINPHTTLPQIQNAVPAAPSAPASTPSSPADSVTLNPAAQKAAKAGDVDHDGDSH